jgi:hypothetical protein
MCCCRRCNCFRQQFGVKFGGPFGKVVFGGGDSDVDELNKALQWVEGELAKTEGPFFIGKDFTLVRPEAWLLD